MKILVVADEECPALWDYYVPGRLKEFDLIISCGDLKPAYLSFLVTMARCPVLYVHGNHDGHYEQTPPEGCDCIDGKIVEYNGVRIMGMGGCRQYRPGPHQYTDREMGKRLKKMRLNLMRSRGVDIVVTHAPPRGVGDAEDPAHIGFSALRDFMDKYQPMYLLHGHVHTTYNYAIEREHLYGGTWVINCYERYTLELADRDVPEKKQNQLIWYSRPPKRGEFDD